MKKTTKKAMPKAKYGNGDPSKTKSFNVSDMKTIDAKKVRKGQGDTSFVFNKVKTMTKEDSSKVAPFIKDRYGMAKQKKGGAVSKYKSGGQGPANKIGKMVKISKKIK